MVFAQRAEQTPLHSLQKLESVTPTTETQLIYKTAFYGAFVLKKEFYEKNATGLDAVIKMVSFSVGEYRL
jgi:hypothetical protein